jgi:hypothetical protein
MRSRPQTSSPNNLEISAFCCNRISGHYAAHKLARILYAMVKHRTPFDPDRLGNPEQSRARKERFLRRQAEQLGFTLTPVE